LGVEIGKQSQSEALQSSSKKPFYMFLNIRTRLLISTFQLSLLITIFISHIWTGKSFRMPAELIITLAMLGKKLD